MTVRISHIKDVLLMCVGASLLWGCQTSQAFNPRGDYPPDPWVKGYSNPDDCLGGEALAALKFELPEYPRKAFNSGRQGWTIIKLDVDASGETQNVSIERSVPDRFFPGPSLRAVQDWKFEPPKKEPLENCRVLIRYQFGKVSLGG